MVVMIDRTRRTIYRMLTIFRTSNPYTIKTLAALHLLARDRELITVCLEISGELPSLYSWRTASILNGMFSKIHASTDFWLERFV